LQEFSAYARITSPPLPTTLIRFRNASLRQGVGDEGWQGSWAEIAFNVSQASPFITLPRDVARLEAITVCNHPTALNNQFFEYLQFGNGRMSTTRCGCPGQLAAYARNNAITFTDLTSTPQYLRAH
jgi:hypothetical protein